MLSPVRDLLRLFEENTGSCEQNSYLRLREQRTPNHERRRRLRRRGEKKRKEMDKRKADGAVVCAIAQP